MGETRFEDFVGSISALGKEIQRLTASELARMVDVSRAAMSRTVAHLAEDGFVEVGDAEDEDASKYRAPVRHTEKG